MKLRNKKTGVILEVVAHRVGDYRDKFNSLAELNEEWEDYEEPEWIRDYWFIDSFGNSVKQEDDILGSARRKIGNYFETEEEAEKAVEKLKAWKRLKDRGFRFNGWIREHKKGSADITIASFIDEDYDITNDINLLFGGEE